MSIYIARSPYRTALQSRRRLKISFPRLGALSAKSAASGQRIDRAKRFSAVSDATIRARRPVPAGRQRGASFGNQSAADIGGAIKRLREATMRFEFGPASAISGLFIIAILLGLMYLAHFNQVATKGYDLRRLEADRQQLLNQYDIKNMKLAGVKSLANIAATDRVSAMRRPGEITYVRGNTALASR